RFFLRTSSTVDAFDFDAATGALGAAPVFSIPVSSNPGFFGMEQIALHPSDAKLYVSEDGVVNVFDATDGSLRTSISDPSISSPTGICFAVTTCGNAVLDPGEECDDGNLVNGDGCSSRCAIEPCNPICDDFIPCTDDRCQVDSTSGAFVCVHVP